MVFDLFCQLTFTLVGTKDQVAEQNTPKTRAVDELWLYPLWEMIHNVEQTSDQAYVLGSPRCPPYRNAQVTCHVANATDSP
ncbi:hypothetical protein D3C80_1516150 [compost metagenome]